MIQSMQHSSRSDSASRRPESLSPLDELPEAARRIYDKALKDVDGIEGLDEEDKKDVAWKMVTSRGWFYTAEGWLKKGSAEAKRSYPGMS